VRVNAIAPGPIIPPPDSEGKAVDSIAAQTCLGKWGGLEPVVKAVDYLLADDFVTGEILKVDGGLFLKQRFGKDQSGHGYSAPKTSLLYYFGHQIKNLKMKKS
jgi:enoyl-[acyl-carrier-protein] reductase (NADH)